VILLFYVRIHLDKDLDIIFISLFPSSSFPLLYSLLFHAYTLAENE